MVQKKVSNIYRNPNTLNTDKIHKVRHELMTTYRKMQETIFKDTDNN